MIGKSPSKKTIEAMKIALNTASAKQDDKARALKLWNDLRWRIKTLDGSYESLQNLICEFVARAEREIISEQIRGPIIDRLREMHGRLNDWTIDLDSEEEP